MNFLFLPSFLFIFQAYSYAIWLIILFWFRKLFKKIRKLFRYPLTWKPVMKNSNLGLKKKKLVDFNCQWE